MNSIREEFGFDKVPIKLIFRKKALIPFPLDIKISNQPRYRWYTAFTLKLTVP